MAQLSSQFEAVVIDRPLARAFNGKISPAPTRQQLANSPISEARTGNDPRAGSPRASEEEDVDAHERDQRLVGVLIIRLRRANRGDNELGNGHADSTEHEQRPTAPLLDEVEAGNGRADVDGTGDHGDNERIADAGVQEVGSSVIEN